MGKNHKHKKRLKEQKSKTQLKNAAKELLKRQNVTNTEFKVKPIVIAPQLPAKITEGGRRDLDLNDVVKKLQHPNDNSKIRACQDFEYLIKNTEELPISYHFRTVCHLIIDQMPNVRKAGLKLLNVMLSKNDESRTPDCLYLSLLNHLRVAMTNINKRMAEDSVLFFDLLLDYLPNKTAKHFYLILPSFLMLISSLKHNAESRRTVTVNLESKFTSSQWRIAVLSRLHLLLEIILKRRIKKDEGMAAMKDRMSRFPFYVCFVENNWYEELVGSDDEYAINEERDKEDVHKQFGDVFSLLYEIWLEGRPVRSSKHDVTTCLSDETAVLFNCLVQTYHSLFSYIGITKSLAKIRRDDHEKLIRNFVQHLPYSLVKKPKKNEKWSNKITKFLITDIKCNHLNLLICKDYLILFATNPSKAKAEDVAKVANTVIGYLRRDYGANKKMDFTDLFLILRHLFDEKARLWCRNKFPVGEVLSAALILYKEGHLEYAKKLELTRILTKITYKDLLANEDFDLWLQNLPKLLIVDTIDAELLIIIIDRIRLIFTTFNASFYKGIQDNYIAIYNNLPNLKITGLSEHEIEIRKYHIATFIKYFPEPCPELKIILNQLDTSNPFWKEIEQLRFERNDDP